MLMEVVPQGHCMVIERFGKPVRVASSGLKFFIPLLDSPKNVKMLWGDETNKKGIFIELTEQILDTKPRECFSKDNVKVEIDCVFRWRVVDPIKAIYEVDHLHQALIEIVLNEARSLIGGRDLNEILSSRSAISEQIATTIAETTRRWGVNVTAVEIKQLSVDTKTQEAMLRQMEAARESEAIKLKSEGEAAALVKKAEAEKQAAVVRARGESEAMTILANAERAYVKALAESMTPAMAAQILLAEKTLRTYTTLSTGAANKVFMPTSSTGLLQALEGAAAGGK